MAPAVHLAKGIRVLERGWLSANNIVLTGGGPSTVVDTGYATHSTQTLALVKQALDGQSLDLVLNTHLHSDHCGGNAAIQSAYPGVTTLIPPGHAEYVRHWDPVALTYGPTGQYCPPFQLNGTLEPGTEMDLGDTRWQIHAAPGHDQHSIVLFEPRASILISADALWENGFGVVFQELEGQSAFAEVAATLNLIERLSPSVVIPGHGRVFTDSPAALRLARARLEAFVLNPKKHASHAVKVLLKFKLLEVQSMTLESLRRWAGSTAYFGMVHQRHFQATPFDVWLGELTTSLVRSGAAMMHSGCLLNA